MREVPWGAQDVSQTLFTTPREGVLRCPASVPRAVPPRRAARARTARAVLTTGAALVAAIAIAAPARADLAAVGPVDPATQVPAWFQDGTGLKLGLCLDGPPFCLGAVGDFGLPDGEAFYWNAGADLASGTLKAKLVLAQEAVSPPSGPAAFMRIRVRITGGLPRTRPTPRRSRSERRR